MNTNVYTINKRFSLASIEVNNEEVEKLYNALHRIINDTDNDIKEKYAYQDKEILKCVLDELDKIISTKTILELIDC